ncbi:MAG: phage adaptor protein [Candidatus Heimdallarchaeaceae archaeon]
MKFRDDSSEELGLVEDIDDICYTDSTSYPYKQKARNINNWYRRVVSWIRECPSDWEYDDSNLTYPPSNTHTLVADTQEYTLDTDAQKVERVEVLDDEGNYQRVTPIDKDEIEGALSEYKETAGLPTEYDLVGRTVVLYPKPGTGYITTSAGLKVYVARDIDEFTSTDTTQEPGFASNFHRILSLGASFDFIDDPTKKNFLKAQINEMKEELQKFYSTRHREYPNVISPHRHNYN